MRWAFLAPLDCGIGLPSAPRQCLCSPDNGGGGGQSPRRGFTRHESQCTCVHTPTHAGKPKCEAIWAQTLLKALLPFDI